MGHWRDIARIPGANPSAYSSRRRRGPRLHTSTQGAMPKTLRRATMGLKESTCRMVWDVWWFGISEGYVLVHADNDPNCASRLDVAVYLASEHGAHLTGSTSWNGPAAGYVALELPRPSWTISVANSKSSRDRQRSDSTTGAPRGIKGEWRVEEGEVVAAMKLHARYADLAIVGQGIDVGGARMISASFPKNWPLAWDVRFWSSHATAPSRPLARMSFSHGTAAVRSRVLAMRFPCSAPSKSPCCRSTPSRMPTSECPVWTLLSTWRATASKLKRCRHSVSTSVSATCSSLARPISARISS